MKVTLLWFFMLIVFTSYGQIPEMNNPDKFSDQVNKWFVDSINKKPLDFYLNHPKIDKYSKLYYQGKFAASDDDFTFAFLDSVLTNNQETKDFYLFVFNSVLSISDGALAEYISHDCRLYFEKSPCEFLGFKNDKLYSANYEEWINQVAFDYYGEDSMININKQFATLKTKVQHKCPKYLTELENNRLKIIKIINENQ